ncbi:small multi-drug export protein [Microbacterium sp. JZ31]|uniref:small multi-drug export protein n=1 Tax=Microbacterium sp. JZ31 TaxID=1906274 RepID=UPI0019344198|nr:small multi-drug export protein [Microbacterium sp. JZ31]
MLDSLQSFTESLPPALQWLGVILLGAIPFVESYFGSFVGVLAGLSPWVAVPAAIIGNVISMLIFVLGAHGVRKAATRNREAPALSPRRAKLKERLERFGVPGVSLLGQLVLPSQITSAAIVGFGASRNAVIFWQVISIVLWGVVFGVLAMLGVQAITRF